MWDAGGHVYCRRPTLCSGWTLKRSGGPETSVLRVGSGGGEEVCLSCMCTQVSHQAWGLGLKGQGMVTKHLVREGQQRLVVVVIHATAVGRQKPRPRCCDRGVRR